MFSSANPLSEFPLKEKPSYPNQVAYKQTSLISNSAAFKGGKD